MNAPYILAIDQSTSGTKALLFSQTGTLLARTDRSHRQIINELGWVEHDPVEIYQNTVAVAQDLITESGIDPCEIAGLGISNQRETAMAWDAQTGKPLYNAIVWQCARGEAICNRLAQDGHAEAVRQTTGLQLSPYFSAAKLAWLIENIPAVQTAAHQKTLRCGTMDSWLIWQLTDGQSFKTDYSNASRTQLFNLTTLQWDAKICNLFGLDMSMLATVCESNSLFGMTTIGDILPQLIPIHSAMGDSHSALFGQGCHEKGLIKATYGTGSSVMLNIGQQPILTNAGIVTSIAWGMNGIVDYVLEGNINYTGAVIKWVVEELGLLASSKDAGVLAATANLHDETYLVPAFSGLGAPYWESRASAVICNMTRQTGKAEIVRAAEDCIAHQITDIINLMKTVAALDLKALRVDGGPTRDAYLMQTQSDLLDLPLSVSETAELSGVGAAFAAGIALGIYPNTIFDQIKRRTYQPRLEASTRAKRRQGWKNAVEMVLHSAKQKSEDTI
ncbi:MAG: glycerol kinase GlpK [Eubacteriales bacterium]|nr:glycerol kinase GlpK [Eubacteriales bacterium]